VNHYKNTFGIVFFSSVDANYNFMFVDVGCWGGISDSGFLQRAVYNTGNVTLISSSGRPSKRERKGVIIFFIGDEAFGLSENLRKVYPGITIKGPKGTNFQLQDLQSAQS
jgi:hypothetical protein